MKLPLPLLAVCIVLASVAGAAEPLALEHHREAKAALREGRAGDAGVALKLALQEDPLHAPSHFLLGGLLAREGRREQAVVGFQRTLALDPTHPPALYNLGTLLLERGMAVEAGRLLESAVSLRPEHAASRNNLAKAYFLAGLPELAAASYREVLEWEPRNPVAQANLALLQGAVATAGASQQERPPPGPAGQPTSPAADDDSAAPREPAAVAGLGALLRDLPNVWGELRGGQIAVSGWTRSAQERAVLDRVLARRPEVVDLTVDDAGDPHRMLEIDVVLFFVVGIDESKVGFNFMRFVDVNFTYFASGDASDLAGLAAPGTVGDSIGLPSDGWLFSAAVDYDVNIANAVDERVAVLARPHLSTLSGTPASFLAGGEFLFQVSGIESGDIKPYPFGTSVTVVPTLLRSPGARGEPSIHLAVEAQRTSVLEVLTALEQDESIVFDKLSVTSEAVLGLDETLILSGLNQRESRTILAGVPVLRSIPGLKYFFSTRSEVETNTAVLILLTPRDPAFMDERNHAALARFVELRRDYAEAERQGEEALRRFRERNPDWRRLPPNRFASHFFLGENSEIYRTLSGADLVHEGLDLDLLGEVPDA